MAVHNQDTGTFSLENWRNTALELLTTAGGVYGIVATAPVATEGIPLLLCASVVIGQIGGGLALRRGINTLARHAL